MSVAVKHLSSSGDLNTCRRQERRINISGASNRSSKSRPRLSSTDLLHAADGSAKVAEIMGSQYDTIHGMLAIFGKHDIANLLSQIFLKVKWFLDLSRFKFGFS